MSAPDVPARDHGCGLVTGRRPGQRRRLALCRILTSGAQLWLRDEPFTALDEAAMTSVERHLGEQAERGGLAIVTSHHPLPIDHARVLRLAG
ncbi:MAG: ABC transporter ATP-binding protein [Gammaproteobacteria bacterium]